ncbi:MAG: hypothetical protein QXE71_03200, partial [Candidatus Bathyarchaeia archaeon]
VHPRAFRQNIWKHLNHWPTILFFVFKQYNVRRTAYPGERVPHIAIQEAIDCYRYSWYARVWERYRQKYY